MSQDPLPNNHNSNNHNSMRQSCQQRPHQPASTCPSVHIPLYVSLYSSSSQYPHDENPSSHSRGGVQQGRSDVSLYVCELDEWRETYRHRETALAASPLTCHGSCDMSMGHVISLYLCELDEWRETHRHRKTALAASPLTCHGSCDMSMGHVVSLYVFS